MKNLSSMPPMVPEFQVRDIVKSRWFYLDILGFELEFDRPEEKFAMISIKGSWIMLEQVDSFAEFSDKEFVEGRQWRTGALEYPFGRGINFQIVINDLDARYRRVIELKYPIKVPLEERWYLVDDRMVGVSQFLLMDPDGYLLRLQQDLGIKIVSDNHHQR